MCNFATVIQDMIQAWQEYLRQNKKEYKDVHRED